MHALGLAFLCGTAEAGWPTDDSNWVPFTRGGSALGDPSSDVGSALPRTDLVGDTAEPVAAWFADDETLALRMRLNDDPTGALSLPLRGDTWGYLIDTDGDDAQYELSLLVYAFGGALTFRENVDRAGGVEEEADRRDRGVPWIPSSRDAHASCSRLPAGTRTTTTSSISPCRSTTCSQQASTSRRRHPIRRRLVLRRGRGRGAPHRSRRCERRRGRPRSRRRAQ